MGSLRCPLLVLLLLASLIPRAALGQIPELQNDAGVKPIGFLPPTNEGAVRLLVRALSTTDENARPLRPAPRVRVYAAGVPVACEDGRCNSYGQSALTRELDPVRDTLHLGLVLDGTLKFTQGQSLATALCDGLRDAPMRAQSYSAWRIRDSSGASAIAGPTGELGAFCDQVHQALSATRSADARSPIYQVVEQAISAMAADTRSGLRRELLVISDGVDETCVDTANALLVHSSEACIQEHIARILQLSLANAVPISVLHIDASRAGRSVPLYHAANLRRMATESHGLVRSISLNASQDSLYVTLRDELVAMQAVLDVPVACLASPPPAKFVDVRLAVMDGDQGTERVGSLATRLLATAPLACQNQKMLCDAAGPICATDSTVVARIAAEQTGGTVAPAPKADAEVALGGTTPDGDAGIAQRTDAGPETQDAEASTSTEPAKAEAPLDARQWALHGAMGLGAFLVLAGIIMWRRGTEDAKQPYPTQGPLHIPAPLAPLTPSAPPTSRPTATMFEGDERRPFGRDKTVAEAPLPRAMVPPGAPTLLAAPPLGATYRGAAPPAALSTLRAQPTHAGGPSIVALGVDGRPSVVALGRDEYVRIAYDPSRGITVTDATHAQLVLRYDSGERHIEARAIEKLDLWVNRIRVSHVARADMGDVIHLGPSRVPIEVRGPETPAITTATLVPMAAQGLALPVIRVENAEIVVGRDPQATPGWEFEFAPVVRLPIDPLADSQRRRISSDHLVVWIAGGVLWARDISSNGTQLNGVPMVRGKATVVPKGAELRLSTEVAYRVAGVA